MSQDCKLSDKRVLKATPAGFYAAYPASDLLPIEPPPAAMSPVEFLNYLRDNPSGDGLFDFLATELFEERDELTLTELQRRMERARLDAVMILYWLQSLEEDPEEQ
jgi:hypothetical protein